MILKPYVYLHIQVCFLSWHKVSLVSWKKAKKYLSVLSLVFILNPLYFPAGEKLQSLSDEEWTVFLSQLCSSIEEQSHSTSTATQSKLNLLCYLGCVVGHTVIANRLINSRLVGKHICFRLLLKYDLLGGFLENSCITVQLNRMYLISQPYMTARDP